MQPISNYRCYLCLNPGRFWRHIQNSVENESKIVLSIYVLHIWSLKTYQNKSKSKIPIKFVWDDVWRLSFERSFMSS